MVSKIVVETVDTVDCRKSEQTEKSAMKSLFEKNGWHLSSRGAFFVKKFKLKFQNDNSFQTA
jgi:hypothetical protein